jgi:hypothetical protein
MAASPKYKIYDHTGTYQAACKEIEAAAAVVSFYGEGSTIREGHGQRDIVRREGEEGLAGESYDFVATYVKSKGGKR